MQVASGMLSKVRQLAVEFHWDKDADLSVFQGYVALLKSLENKMVRFDSKYNPWGRGFKRGTKVPALSDYTGPWAFEIAWYQVIP